MSSAEKSDKEPSIPDEAKRILRSLAAEWDDIPDPEALQVIRLKGAMTNEVYQIKWLTDSDHDETLPKSRKVLMRIYGAGVEVFFNREDEIRTFEFMSKQGRGPRLLGRFSNGRVEEFIRARTLTAADLRDPEISALIATKMKEFHHLDMPGRKTVVLWDRLQWGFSFILFFYSVFLQILKNYAFGKLLYVLLYMFLHQILRQCLSNWLKGAKRLSSPEEAKEFRFSILEDELSALQKHLSTGHQLVGFCHNDLQYGNIMMDEETRLITIIDYEYASYNHVAYDIANHFCEMAADYHTETPHVLDYRKYPGFEERQRFVHIYLSSSGTQPGDLEVKQLLHAVEKYTLASHIYWGLWGIISEHVNKIDFDYMEYARQRFQQYWAKKPELLEFSNSTKP